MDDDARAELDALRRRAYGPDADIAADPVALARLTALEDLARGDRAGRERAPATPAPPDTASLSVRRGGQPSRETETADDRAEARTPDGRADVPQAAPEAGPARRRRRSRFMLGTASAALVAVLATATVVTLSRDDETISSADPLPTAVPLSWTEVIERIPVEGPYGNSMTIRYSDSWPEIPVSGTVDWASFLGEQFGWELWIYGIETEPSREHCLLLERHGNVRFACAPVADAAQGQLHLELPIEEIAVARRVVGADRLDFQWRADGVVTVSAVTAP